MTTPEDLPLDERIVRALVNGDLAGARALYLEELATEEETQP